MSHALSTTGLLPPLMGHLPRVSCEKGFYSLPTIIERVKSKCGIKYSAFGAGWFLVVGGKKFSSTV